MYFTKFGLEIKTYCLKALRHSVAPPLMERALHILDMKFNMIDSREFCKI